MCHTNKKLAQNVMEIEFDFIFQEILAKQNGINCFHR